MYVFDTSGLIALMGFFPSRFPTLWQNIGQLISLRKFVSVKEVYREIEDRGDGLFDWAEENKTIFYAPTMDEATFIAEIFKISHFQQAMAKQKQLNGGAFADPFVIAKARVDKGIVVTQEKIKANASKIPNICQHFSVGCIDLEKMMEQEGWSF